MESAEYDANGIVKKIFLDPVKQISMKLIGAGFDDEADITTAHHYKETVKALVAAMDRFVASNEECRMGDVMEIYTDHINMLWHYKDALDHEKHNAIRKIFESLGDAISPHAVDPHKFNWTDFAFLGTCALGIDALLALFAYRILEVSIPWAWVIGIGSAILQGAKVVYDSSIKTDECLE